MDRRKFLKNTIGGIGGSILTSSLIDFYLLNVYRGMIHQAFGLPQGGEVEKKFLNVAVYGGMPGWMWNIPLRPNGDSDAFSYGYQTNDPSKSMLWTKFVSDSAAPGGFSGRYEHTRVGDWHLPHLWSGLIARPDGQTEQMSKLAANMLAMRGIKLQFDDHEGNRYRNVRPEKGLSIGGLVADRATTPMPAIAFDAGVNYFKSAKGISQLELTKDQTFASAFSSFQGAGERISGNATLQSKLDGVLDLMKANSALKNSSLPTTYSDRVAARKLMTKDLVALEAQFNTMKSKYLDLITRAISDPLLRLEGLDNVAMPGQVSKHFRLSTTSDGSKQGIYYGGDDIRNLAANASIPWLAEQFAISELMLTGGSIGSAFSSSINIVAFGGFFAKADKVYVGESSTAPVLNRQYYFPVDSHYVGSHAHLILHSKYARALSSCLYELITRLKGVSLVNGSLFDSTLIAVTTEFNRTNDQLQVGTGHGYTGSGYTLFSGSIPKTTVVGNIKADAAVENFGGTWGEGAPMGGTVSNGNVLSIGNAVSTACQILGVPSPTPLYPSLATRNPVTGKVSVPEVWARPENIS